MQLHKLLILLITCLSLTETALPCSSVFVHTGSTRLIGRTMDWKTGNGDVLVNARGIAKKASALQDRSRPATWTSRYGSVTFNLKVRFNWLVKIFIRLTGIRTSAPSCGMNEKGLWGGSLWVHVPPAVIYPKYDGCPSINDWQLLEYVLDTSASVRDAIRNIRKVRVSGFKEAGFESDLHWYIADASGDSAIIEFPNGKLKVHRDPQPPAMTNSFYEHSRRYLKQFKGFGGDRIIPFKKGEMTSENRFLFAVYALHEQVRAGNTSLQNMFDIMKTVTQTNVRHMETSQAITQWTTVYDLKGKKIFWTSRVSPEIKSIDVKAIDFTKKRNKKLDINTKLSGVLNGYL
jgi:penicillin V acylase-like amidase (Ntn superfamily)